MNDLQTALDEYLTIRRILGFKLRDEGSVLPQFLNFIENKGASFITTDLALQWATQPKNVLPAHWARRLSMVRIFARFCSAMDPSYSNSAKRSAAFPIPSKTALYLF